MQNCLRVPDHDSMPDLKTRMLSKHQTNLNNNEKYFRCFYDILILLCIRFTDTKGKPMGLNSFLFVLFVVISLFIYYVIPKKLQWIWLLVISYVYYITNSRGLVVFIAATTLTTWYAGLLLEKTEENKKRRLIVALTLLFNFGILAVLKYTNFFIANINDLFHTSILQFSWALPLGISFYTFQSMGYLLDICWKRTTAEKNLFRFALFVSFFPQILQGPIGRYSRLAHQLYEEHSFDPGRFERGFQRILWGFFKKMVIADNALYFVNPLFKEYQTYDGVALFATVFYAIQLYMDFSGGIDVVIGIADLFGVTMDENFRQPYFAVSITDFWHRWHITLGTWMKDYVFYPISLSKWMGRFGKWSKKTFGKQTGTDANGEPIYEETTLSKIAQGGYEILTNRADSLANNMAFGWLFSGISGEVLKEFMSALPMGISAATEAVAKAKERGATDEQAYLVSAFTLLAETATEAISLENMSAAFQSGVTARTAKDFLKNWLTKAGVSEMVGESVNDIVENLADELIMGEMSDHADRVYEYRMKGYTKDEAEYEARKEEIKGVLHTALISYLSPGLDVVQYARGRYHYYGEMTRALQETETANMSIRDVRRGIRAEEKRIDQEYRDIRKGKTDTSTKKTGPVNTTATETTAETGATAETAVTPETATTATETKAAPKANTEQENSAKQFTVDFEILESAKNYDKAGQQAAVASVIDEGGTQDSNRGFSMPRLAVSRAYPGRLFRARLTRPLRRMRRLPCWQKLYSRMHRMMQSVKP